MTRTPGSGISRHFAVACMALLCLAEMASAYAWTLTLSGGSRRLFLHVGNGAVSGPAGTLNGAPGRSGIVNTVSVSPTVAQLLSGGPLPMSSDSTQITSLYGDGAVICPTPSSQVMVGAGYRRNGGPADAVLTVSSVSATLDDMATGESIPINQISWTVSAPGSTTPNVISAGTFNLGTQLLANVPRNRYIENCHSFTYANGAVRAAGTYTGRVTYTLATP